MGSPASRSSVTERDSNFGDGCHDTRALGLRGGARNSSSNAWIRGRMVRAAYCSFLRSDEGTITSASTVQERHAEVLRRRLAPLFRLAQRVLVADNETWLNLLTKTFQLVVRPSAQNKSHVPLKKSFANIAHPLNEKSVTAQVGVRRERNQAEKCHHRLAKNIRRLDSHVERRVIHSSLRALHPVDNTPPFGVGRAFPPHRHPCIFSQLAEGPHS